MKRIIYLGMISLILCLSAAAPPAAWAQDTQDPLDYSAQEKKPGLTGPDYVAMIFSKLAGKAPDFESWVRGTQEFQDAAKPEKTAVRERLLKDMKSAYNLLTLQEPITIETQVKLSAYSASNSGFFVESFKPDTFFPVRYNKQSYAIVPQEIMEKQWLKVTELAAAKAIDDAALNQSDKPLTLLLTLVPKYADGSKPARLGDESYWLISAEVKKMALYSPDSSSALWESEDTEADNAKRQELLNLRQ
jgi:hypothetical protein